MDANKIADTIAPLKWGDKVIVNEKTLYRWEEILGVDLDDNFQVKYREGFFYKEWDKSKMMFPKVSHRVVLYHSSPGSEDFSKAVLENIETGEKEEVKSIYVDPDLLSKRKKERY